MTCLVCQQPLIEAAGYSRCSHCGLVASAYPANYDLNRYTDKYVKLFGTDMELRINANRVANIMRWLPIGSSVLDYGCSCGNFLARLEAHGYRAFGYEPCKSSAENKTCESRIVTEVENIKGKFDMVTMFDVFEHFEKPRNVFTAIDSFVGDGGYVLINTPNPQNVADPASWYHFWPGEHIYFWTPTALTLFMKEFGYGAVEEHYQESILRKNDPTPEALVTMVFKKRV